MTLRPGHRLSVAARFHLDADWDARVGVGRGVEEADGEFFPLGPWRPPTPAELAALVAGPNPPAAAADSILLFRLPEHVRDEWWDMLDAAAGSGGPIPGFDAFAGRVREFLDFKGLAPSGPVQMEVVATAAGERSIRRDPDTGRPAGLGPTVAPWAAYPPGADVAVRRLHAVVNLGDEPTGVVLINLSLAGLAAELHPGSKPPPGTPVGELVGRFLRGCPEYPPVRVRLGPGEGVGLPPAGLVLDGDPTGKQEPDLLLLISAG